MTEIVHEDENIRLVRLNEHYYSGGDQLVQLFARFNEHTIVLSHSYSISGKPKSFMLNATEMEALANAWITYTNDQREKAETEAQRLINVEAEAYRLASTCKAIQIEKRDDGNLRWNVAMPDFGWHGCSYVADDLLECVKQAIEYCRPIQEAYRLAKDYPINFNHKRGTSTWWISINDLFGNDAFQNTILDVVQQAIVTYKQWQAEQERIKKVLVEVERLTKHYPAVTTALEAERHNEKSFWYVRLSNGPLEVAHSADELLIKVHQLIKQFIERENDLIKQND